MGFDIEINHQRNQTTCRTHHLAIIVICCHYCNVGFELFHNVTCYTRLLFITHPCTLANITYTGCIRTLDPLEYVFEFWPITWVTDQSLHIDVLFLLRISISTEWIITCSWCSHQQITSSCYCRCGYHLFMPWSIKTWRLSLEFTCKRNLWRLNLRQHLHVWSKQAYIKMFISNSGLWSIHNGITQILWYLLHTTVGCQTSKTRSLNTQIRNGDGPWKPTIRQVILWLKGIKSSHRDYHTHTGFVHALPKQEGKNYVCTVQIERMLP